MKLQYAIGGTIRELRRDRAMTLRELSGKSLMSLGFLSEIECGVKQASTDTLEFIAKGLDLTTLQLLREIYNYLEKESK